MPRNKRRLVEGLKSLLILLLTLSALFLLSLSPLVQGSGLSSLLPDNLTSTAGPDAAPTGLTSAAIPARMAVGSDMGLYGVQYDQSGTDALFDLAGPLLGEALSSAQSPARLTLNQWRSRLSGICVYFDFTCPVPLSALCAWLNGGTVDSALTDAARYILLAQEADGTLSLCYGLEENLYYRCATTLDADLHLTPILDSVTPNSAFFAFEDDTLPDIIAPHTLFTGEELSPAIYNSSTPLFLSESTQTAQLLSALSFSDQNRANVSDGVLYVDGEDTLRLSGDGSAIYSSSGSGKYPAGEGLSGAVEAAWALAEQALNSLNGDARLYLMSAQEDETEGSYTVTFGYMLNGSVVRLYDQGWAARFRAEAGSIREFTLYLRSYTPSGRTKLLLPAEKAAAALTALTNTAKELVIQYQDNGNSTTEPGWLAR